MNNGSLMSALAKNDGWIYFLALALGVGAGVIQVKLGDLLLTALVVMALTMLLGILRPQQPWRWMIIVGAMALLLQAAAYLFLTGGPPREQIFESMLGFLTGTVGAYAGSLFRRALHLLTEDN